MSLPMVCAIMLTKNREEMARRAVRAFERQTYAPKTMLVVNSGVGPLFMEWNELREPAFVGVDTLSIGELRNLACKYASTHYAESWNRPEIFVHFDDDDWSHPNRIAEQVELLKTSGADAVGYNEMLFWRTRPLDRVMGPLGAHFGKDRAEQINNAVPGEVWLYSNAIDKKYCMGTSLCYWRETWEKKHFADLPKAPGGTGEDTDFIRGLKTVGVSSIGIKDGEPQLSMIATIHGRNAMPYKVEEHPFNWKRAPGWDRNVRKTMEEA